MGWDATSPLLKAPHCKSRLGPGSSPAPVWPLQSRALPMRTEEGQDPPPSTPPPIVFQLGGSAAGNSPSAMNCSRPIASTPGGGAPRTLFVTILYPKPHGSLSIASISARYTASCATQIATRRAFLAVLWPSHSSSRGVPLHPALWWALRVVSMPS